MLNTAQFDDLLEAIEQLSSEQKRIVRQRLNEDWAVRFGKALADIRADLPAGLSEEEIQADIEATIDDVRREQH